MSTRFDRDALEKLRERKRLRHFYRLVSTTAVEHEYRGQNGHPSSYAFVRFECAPADELSFEARAAWPSSAKGDEAGTEKAIAEGIADELLSGMYEHSGCAVTLVEVRYDAVGSSQLAFMRATRRAMQELLACKWTFVERQKG